MKKITKLVAIVLCLTLVLTMLAACGTNGTYYLMVDGEKSDSVWIKIDGDTWTSSEGGSGECKVDGDKITLTASAFGISVDFMSGTKDGNTIDFGLLEYQK